MRVCTSSLSVRSIGTGEIAPSPTESKKEDTSSNDSSAKPFVVRNFRGFTSDWLHVNKNNTKYGTAKENTKTLTKQRTGSTDSNSSESELEGEETDKSNFEASYDTTTDLSYHNASEQEGAKLVHQALTADEQSRMPDAYMPLRHYRAEKVGRFLFFCCFVRELLPRSIR